MGIPYVISIENKDRRAAEVKIFDQEARLSPSDRISAHAIGVTYKDLLYQAAAIPFKCTDIVIQYVSGDRMIISPKISWYRIVPEQDRTMKTGFAQQVPLRPLLPERNKDHSIIEFNETINENMYFIIEVPPRTRAIMYFYPE